MWERKFAWKAAGAALAAAAIGCTTSRDVALDADDGEVQISEAVRFDANSWRRVHETASPGREEPEPIDVPSANDSEDHPAAEPAKPHQEVPAQCARTEPHPRRL